MPYKAVWRGSGARNLTCIEEAKLLYNNVIGLPAGSLIVEIGSYEGCSSVVLASVADERNQRLLCVDPLVPFSNGGVPVTEETPKLFKRNVLDKYKNVTWAGHGVRSVEAAKDVNEEVSFIYLDAEHTYAAVLEDCTAWLPKLKPGHCIAFHDFYHLQFGPLIKSAVDEYCVGWEVVGGERSVEVYRRPR